MFQQFRMQALSNPNVLPQMLGYVAQNHPDIHQLLTSNPNLLLHLLIHGRPNVVGAPGQDTGPVPPGSNIPPPGPNQQMPPMPPMPPQPPQQPTIELSEDDNTNINTIMQMGFTRNQAIEAYLVCNKNVEMAINYLFDQG
jgi:UV excision repair protein RAD23